MEKVIVYGTAWCPWCVRAKDFFEQQGVPYEWKNADVHENAEEAFKKSKQTGIPVIDIDGNIVVGFDVEKVKTLLKSRK
jgi:glutaredoxin-like YruB-family protein